MLFMPLWIIFSIQYNEYGIGLLSFSLDNDIDTALFAIMFEKESIKINILFIIGITIDRKKTEK